MVRRTITNRHKYFYYKGFVIFYDLYRQFSVFLLFGMTTKHQLFRSLSVCQSITFFVLCYKQMLSSLTMLESTTFLLLIMFVCPFTSCCFVGLNKSELETLLRNFLSKTKLLKNNDNWWPWVAKQNKRQTSKIRYIFTDNFKF